MTAQCEFPKIDCPFVRREYPVSADDFDHYGAKLSLKSPVLKLVTDDIVPGYEWVFEDPNTIAIEKLDGNYLHVTTSSGRITACENRLQRIDPLALDQDKTYIFEGLLTAIQQGHLKDNQALAGELIGPHCQGNPYKLDNHVWYPFTVACEQLKYKSFNYHDRTFKKLSHWFRYHLKSLHHARRVGFQEAVFAQGIIFYNLKRRDQGLPYMAKLRRDMFDWYYADKLKLFGEIYH